MQIAQDISYFSTVPYDIKMKRWRRLQMTDFTINEMLAMQRQLQEKYKDQWEPVAPEAGRHKLLWMVRRSR